MQLPSITTGNLPLIILACDRKEDANPALEYPYAHNYQFHDEPRVRTVNLAGDTIQHTLLLWLPTPTVALADQPKRTLTICWSLNVVNAATPFTPPSFEVLLLSRPSRPSINTPKFSSTASPNASLANEVVVTGPVNDTLTLTEISGIKSGSEVIPRGDDALCMLAVRLPAKLGANTLIDLHFYIFGMAVDQW